MRKQYGMHFPVALLLLLSVKTTNGSVFSNARSAINVGTQTALHRQSRHPFVSLSSGISNVSAKTDLKKDTFSTKQKLQTKATKEINQAKKIRHDRKKKSLPPASSAHNTRPLSFFENMICGAVSRSVAQTIMHPANTMKTILQSRPPAGEARMTLATLARPKNLKLLTRGAGAQFLLSVPHGAINFAVLEYVRRQLNGFVESRSSEGKLGIISVGPGLDFVSSAISTVCCSVVSTPQMMITDNIMAGTYSNLPKAVLGLSSQKGIKGFYTGWWPGLAGKIPSYGMTWAFFQQLKRMQLQIMERPPRDIENSIMGCIASATTVSIMIPMDTIKTRLVTQANVPDLVPYKGIIDCASRVYREEGIGMFYRGLAPRLISVVPMIGIQFGVYEFMKKFMMARNAALNRSHDGEYECSSAEDDLNEIIMEVAADDEQPFPAPRFYHKVKLIPERIGIRTKRKKVHDSR